MSLLMTTKKDSLKPNFFSLLFFPKNFMNAFATSTGVSIAFPSSAFMSVIRSLLKFVFVVLGAKYLILTLVSPSSLESAWLNPRSPNLLVQ